MYSTFMWDCTMVTQLSKQRKINGITFNSKFCKQGLFNDVKYKHNFP